MFFLGCALFFSIFSFLLAAQSGCSCLVQEAFLTLSADHVCMYPTLLLAIQEHLVRFHSSAAPRGAGWLCVGSTCTSAGTDKAPFSDMVAGHVSSFLSKEDRFCLRYSCLKSCSASLP